MAGIAIEVSRQAYVESMLAFACDAAAIAGARYDVTNVQANALQIFNANFLPGTMGINVTPVVTYNATTDLVTVSATSTMPTILGGVLGVGTLNVGATSEVQRTFGGLELILLLDVTGSMSQNNKIGGLITAATSLVNTIYQGQTTRPNTAIGIVPFVTTINIGANNTGWLSDPLTVATFPTTVPWAGCVKSNSLLQTGDENFDTPPPGNLWPTYYADSTIPFPDDCIDRDNDWHMVATLGTKRKCPGLPPVPGNLFEIWDASGSIDGPNRSCPPPIMPLHNNSVDVINYVNQLVPINGGGTMGNLGFVWAGRVLSPSWSGLWNVQQADGTIINGQPTQPYNSGTSQKAIIMMTDGGSQWYDDPLPPIGDPTAYGSAPNDRYAVGKLGSSDINDFVNQVNSKISRLCTALKADGIKIYTITFRVTDPTVNAIYSNCATTPADFAPAANNAELLTIFTNIAQQLQNLKIVG